jgi:uncharacterized protein YhjY with autotransporter beta-barrel domain
VPGFGLRYERIDFGQISETGGVPALAIKRRDYESVQARAGLDIRTRAGQPLQFYASMFSVHQLNANPASFGANFSQGVGDRVSFDLASDDRQWAEFGCGASYDTEALSIGLSVDKMLGRTDAETGVLSGWLSVRF